MCRYKRTLGKKTLSATREREPRGKKLNRSSRLDSLLPYIREALSSEDAVALTIL